MNCGRMFVITLRKGGVGKTTVAMNLSIYLQQQGRNVAYLDLDPQRDGYEFFKRERSRLTEDLRRFRTSLSSLSSMSRGWNSMGSPGARHQPVFRRPRRDRASRHNLILPVVNLAIGIGPSSGRMLASAAFRSFSTVAGSFRVRLASSM